MNKERLINHLNYYVQWYVLGIIILLIIGTFLYFFLPDYIKEQKPEDYSDLKDSVYDAYEINPNILIFDDNNIAILKMDILYSEVSNGQSSWSLPPIYNDDYDQCAGYIIVVRNANNNFDIDISHFCDMIDY